MICISLALLNSLRGKADGSRPNGANCTEAVLKFTFDLIQAPIKLLQLKKEWIHKDSNDQYTSIWFL
jgi:hypothetical protein